MSDRHPFRLLVHFRPGELHGPILDATGDLLIRELDEHGWNTDDFHVGYTPGLRRAGLWLLEGDLIPVEEGIDLDAKWRRPRPEEVRRLRLGVPVWGGAR